MKWHRSTIEEVFTKTDSGDKGLSSSEARRRLQKLGPNELKEGKKKTIGMMLLMQFKDVMILILLAAAIISGVIGDLTDTIVILIIVVLNAVIGFFQEAHGHPDNWTLHAGGWMGIITAAVAWYTSAAGVVNGMSPTPAMPVGAPLWGRLPILSRLGSPMPRQTEV